LSLAVLESLGSPHVHAKASASNHEGKTRLQPEFPHQPNDIWDKAVECVRVEITPEEVQIEQKDLVSVVYHGGQILDMGIHICNLEDRVLSVLRNINQKTAG